MNPEDDTFEAPAQWETDLASAPVADQPDTAWELDAQQAGLAEDELSDAAISTQDAPETEQAPENPAPASSSEDEEEPEPVRQLRQHIRSLPGDWYVVHTYSGHERRVQDNLMQRVKNAEMEDKIFEAQVPDEYILEYRGSQKKRVRHVRIPGYVIVCMDFDDETYRIVKDTTAVTGFVGDQHNPVPLSEDEVVMLLTPNVMEAAAAEDKSVAAPVQQVQLDFAPGEVVTVIDGAFADTTAVISEIKPETRKLKVLVTLFERETPLELGFEQVRKMDQ